MEPLGTVLAEAEEFLEDLDRNNKLKLSAGDVERREPVRDSLARKLEQAHVAGLQLPGWTEPVESAVPERHQRDSSVVREQISLGRRQLQKELASLMSEMERKLSGHISDMAQTLETKLLDFAKEEESSAPLRQAAGDCSDAHHPVGEVEARAQAMNLEQSKSEFDTSVIRSAILEHLMPKPVYNVQDHYTKGTVWTQLVTHPWFEHMVLTLVAVNALWMWFDTDWNDSSNLVEAHPVFMTAEQLFTFLFSAEILVRFLAFKSTYRALMDRWFVFDVVLVSMMITDAWIMSLVVLLSGASSNGFIGDVSILRLGKMLKLLKMTRIARLMRSFPEFYILIKAVASASRATFFTLGFMFIILYVYSIAFVQLLKGTDVGDRYFTTVPVAITSLWIHCSLLDEVATMARDIQQTSWVCTFGFFTLILLAPVCLMNILVGILCEAISSVAQGERMRLQVDLAQEVLQEIVKANDLDKDEENITKDELVLILQNKKAVKALQNIGIDCVGLLDAADAIFEENGEDINLYSTDGKMTFASFMDMILKLRGENYARVKDLIDIKQQINKVLRHLDRLSASRGKHAAIRPSKIGTI